MTDLPPNTPGTAEDAYLWDPAAAPEPAVTDIERRLASLIPSTTPALALPRTDVRWLRPLLLAAAVVLAASLALYVYSSRRPTHFGPWTLTSPSGVDGVRITSESKGGAILETLTTGAATNLVLADAADRRVHVEPSTSLRVGQSPESLSLVRGGLFIQTPPTGTPQTVGIEPGCRLTIAPGSAASISNDLDRGARMTLKTGQARFSDGKNPDYRIPAEAICRIDPDAGPVAPYFHDAPKELIDGLISLQLALEKSPKAPALENALSRVLKSARPRDAMTLWNLLPRVEGEPRARIAARLSQLAPEAAKSVGADLDPADPKALDLWWEALFPPR